MSSKTQEKSKNYALPIAIMFALFFMIAFVTGYQNPLGDVIKKMSGNSVIASQLGTFANFIAYAVMGYPAGKILQNKGYRYTALMAVNVGFFGVLVTYLSGFIADMTLAVAIYLLGAFIAGFSVCMLNTVVNPMLNSLGKNQKQGNQLVQFGGSCNSLGATLAPVIVGGLIGGSASTISSANPVFYMAMIIFAVAFLVLYFTKLPEAPDFGKDKEKIPASGAFRYSNFVFGMVAIFGYVGLEVGIANFTLQYLSGNESIATGTMTSAAIAGTVTGLYWLLMLVGRLIGGAIGGKVSSRAMLVTTSTLAAVLLLLGIYMPESTVPFFGFNSSDLSFMAVNIPVNAIFLVLCGLCTSVMWGSIFNLSVEGLGKYTQVASGIFMIMVCGGGIIPLIMGAIAGSTGILASFWLLVAVCVYLLAYALVLSRPKSHNDEKLYEDGKEVVA